MSEPAPALYRAFHPARTTEVRTPLVLLNSLATTTTIWNALIPRFADERPVVVVDYAGHGNSPARAIPETLDELSRQLVDVLRTSGIERAHLAGVSIGGLAGLRMAHDAPELVTSLTVIGSTPVMDRALWERRRILVEEWGTAGVRDEVLRRWFTPEFTRRHPAVVQEYETQLTNTTDTSYMAYSTLLAGLDIRSWLADVTTPTLVVSGGEDAAATPEQGRMIAEGVRAGHLHVLPGVAHMVQAMAAHELAELIAGHTRTANPHENG